MPQPLNALHLAMLPLDICQDSIATNLINVENALDRLAGDPHLVVLPELFTSGFSTDRDVLARMAAKDDGPVLDRIRQWVAAGGYAMAGSYLAADSEGRFYNRAFIITPDGQEGFYDKAHLFSLSGEADIFTPGRRMAPVVEWLGWKIRTLVCYDLRFPFWCRNDHLEYDLLLFPANWAVARQYAYNALLIARAIENQAYTAGCNRSGTDPFGIYTVDMSQAYDFMGTQVSTLDPNDGFVHATLLHDKMERYRHKFPVHMDADPLPKRIHS